MHLLTGWTCLLLCRDASWVRTTIYPLLKVKKNSLGIRTCLYRSLNMFFQSDAITNYPQTLTCNNFILIKGVIPQTVSSSPSWVLAVTGSREHTQIKRKTRWGGLPYVIGVFPWISLNHPPIQHNCSGKGPANGILTDWLGTRVWASLGCWLTG